MERLYLEEGEQEEEEEEEEEEGGEEREEEGREVGRRGRRGRGEGKNERLGLRDRQGDRGKGNRNERKGTILRKKYINHLHSLEGKEERVGEKEDGESQRLVYCVPRETKCLSTCILA